MGKSSCGDLYSMNSNNQGDEKRWNRTTATTTEGVCLVFEEEKVGYGDHFHLEGATS